MNGVDGVDGGMEGERDGGTRDGETRDEGIREGRKQEQEQPMQLSRTHRVLLKTEPQHNAVLLGSWEIGGSAL